MKEDNGLDYFKSRVGRESSESGYKGPLVRSVDGRFDLYENRNGCVLQASYSIEHDRIQTEEALLAWILQLSDKTWVTPTLIKDLILAWQTMTGRIINRAV